MERFEEPIQKQIVRTLEFASRLFVFSTGVNRSISRDFLRMLAQAGISVVFGSEADNLAQLVDDARKSGIEIIGCATAVNVELAKSTAKAGGIVIAAGNLVTDWCSSGYDIDASAWQCCGTVIDGWSFPRLQVLVGGS